uniref:Glycosyltransferase n=1 Tax=Salix viminalis TaxID=40686 RepID=A0A6N2L7N9_SALVM
MADKPHAVFIPLQLQSHIKTMLKLAKLLHHKGFHVTFVITEFSRSLLLNSRGPDSLNGLHDFRFETIPDSVPPSDTLASAEDFKKNQLASFNGLLAKLNDTTYSGVPPVTCIVSDGLVPFAIGAAEMLGIPIALFFTISACVFMCSKQFRELKKKGLAPLDDESFQTKVFADRIVDWIPGMKGLRLRDIPRFSRSTDPNGWLFNNAMEAVESASKASAIVLHTFDVLEQEVLNVLSSMSSPIFPIGPLQLLLNQVPDDDLKSIGCNLWKEESGCLQWLGSKEPKSVIYVNFGSIAFISKKQFTEFGMGLAKSGHPFLWAIRPDMVMGDSPILPPELMKETKERGFIASWCPQEEVLSHPSIGGFITHCGWGSTIESISCGVPMLCWPLFADQLTNCRYTCNEWGIGKEIDSNVKGENVEKLVRELMEGEKGKKMKSKSMEYKKLAEEATAPNGSSSMNLDRLINEVLLT